MSESDYPGQGDIVADYWANEFAADPVRAAAELANSVYEQRQAEQAQNLNHVHVAQEAARLLDEAQKFQREQADQAQRTYAVERALAREFGDAYEKSRDKFYDYVSSLPADASDSYSLDELPQFFVKQFREFNTAPDREAWNRIKQAGERRYWENNADEHLKDIRGR